MTSDAAGGAASPAAWPDMKATRKVSASEARREQGSDVTDPREDSLPFGRLPELNLVAFRIHHPAKFPVLGVVRLLEHVAALGAQRRQQGGQVMDAVIDHE